jgi:hypothetical protein
MVQRLYGKEVWLSKTSSKGYQSLTVAVKTVQRLQFVKSKGVLRVLCFTHKHTNGCGMIVESGEPLSDEENAKD